MVAVFCFFLAGGCAFRPSEPIEIFECDTGRFAIRVVARIEDVKWFASGGEYFFECARLPPRGWKPIMKISP
jgi:hypothetical protein